MKDKIKIHTTNYYNTLIEVSEDTKAVCGTEPPLKSEKRTIADLQYELISKNPYTLTSDEILFDIFAIRNNLTRESFQQKKKEFFSKGQPCLRTSPLAKTYGFGIHFDENGKVAIYGLETSEYKAFLLSKELKRVRAMRSSKKEKNN